jgi:hypothetical protein
MGVVVMVDKPETTGFMGSPATPNEMVMWLQALSKVRREALEEAAMVCENWCYGEDAATAIRALKDKP